MASPSFTAFLIPKILISLPHKYFALLTEKQLELSRVFASECAKRDFVIRFANIFGKKLSVWLIDHLSVKGLAVHFAARKKYIRDKLNLVTGEISQVVMIGAGFDTLCLEYRERYPGYKFFELDQPETQDVKLAALSVKPENVNFIPCDLSRQSLHEILPQIFDKDRKSFFVIEGVMMYLDAAAVEKLLGDLSKIAANGSYLVFGSMSELVAANDKRAKLADKALAARKEKYKFAATAEGVKELLAANGFKLLDSKAYHELQRGIVDEKVIEALKKERGEHYYFAQKS